MIAPLMDFLEGVVKELGITRVIREAAQQRQMSTRPHCMLLPQTGTITKDFSKVRRDVYAPGPPNDRITHFIRKWRVSNPIRVVFVAGKDCEKYGALFLAALPKGFEHDGQWIDLTVTSEIPPLDESLLYDAGEIAYDVTFTSGVYVPKELPLFRDATIEGSLMQDGKADDAEPSDDAQDDR